MNDPGIITATDERYGPGAVTLARSVEKSGYPLTVFDLGLSEKTIADLDKAAAQVVKIDLGTLPVSTDVAMWQTWNKPHFLDRSPYDSTLWLDADTEVVGSLDPLFAVIGREPLLTKHFWAEKNWPKRWWPINAGVVGFNRRDRWGKLFRKWLELITKAGSDRQLRETLNCWDEGALILALKVHPGSKIQEERGWNHFIIDHVPFRSVRYPAGTVVVHFMGTKPWLREPYRWNDYAWTRPVCEDNPDWFPMWLDARHSQIVYQAAVTGMFRKIIEVGCHNGSSTSALVKAWHDRHCFAFEVCDTKITESLRKLVTGTGAVMRGYSSLLAIRPGFDLAIIDGDHSYNHVRQEFGRIEDCKIDSLFAHDTAARDIPGCEGSVWLGDILKIRKEWQVIEDCKNRPGEFTHRGFIFASKDPAIFERVKDIWETLMETPLVLL